MINKKIKKIPKKTKGKLFGMNEKDAELFNLKEELRNRNQAAHNRKISFEQASYILLVMGLLYLFRDDASTYWFGIIIGAACVGGVLYTSRWEN